MDRLNYYDNAKFYLILSVILGHLLENNGVYGRISIGLYDTIFLYAMPSFVFISGIFSPSPSKGKLQKEKIVRFLISEWSLFEPLLICSIILAIPTILSEGISTDILRPGYTLWYLLALIWWRLIVFFLPPFITKYGGGMCFY